MFQQKVQQLDAEGELKTGLLLSCPLCALALPAESFLSLKIYNLPSSHLSVYPFICSSMLLSVRLSTHPPIHPSVDSSICLCNPLLIEPAIHSFSKYLWSAGDDQSLLGRAFPGEGMSRCGLRFASLPAGALPMTGTDLPLESFPIVGRLVLLGGRRPFPHGLGNCP